jgi:glycosyltransferase involved in cell wall biosynthesis
VRLFAVGGNPPDWLVRAGQHDARIAVTGYVADERPYLERCTALLLPVQAAGGSRLKALVAMASGLPIVSTALGMEGLEVEPERHYLRAETVDEWARALARLLGEPSVRAGLAHRARALVEQGYDWQAIRPAFTSAYALLDA